jgi:hypothetical protein
MPHLNIDILTPWDLTLEIGGKKFLVNKPKWQDVIEMASLKPQLEAAAKDAKAMAALVPLLKSLVMRIVPDEHVAIVDGLDFDDLIAIFVPTKLYYEDWLKKKQQASISCVLPKAAENAPAAPTASLTNSGK